MTHVKLTKNELKKQKDSLKRFLRYLPTLQLKKQQLQMVLRSIEQKQGAVQRELKALQENMDPWIAIFADEQDIPSFLSLKTVNVVTTNIAGTDIPTFQGIEFEIADYDLFSTPLWVDAAIEAMKSAISLSCELELLKEQHRLIAHELERTSQRVNLFEKVKIPEAKENIRTIQIYLGDQQTAAVVRGKLAKSKVVQGEVA